MNSDLSDLADAMTESLARDGQGGMTAVLPLANTGFTYSNDPNTGMRRTAADTQAISCGAVDVVSISTTGVSITGTLAVSGALTVGGAPLLNIGEGKIWFGTTAPAKWVLCTGQSLLRATYPDLWAFASAEIALGNTLFTNGNGTTTFTVPNLQGYVPAGREAVATRLTSTYFGGNSTILGATGGSESTTLTLGQLPTGINSSGTNSITVTTPASTNIAYSSGIVTPVSYGPGAAGTGPSSSTSNWNTLTSISGNNSISVTSNNTSGNPHRTVQPTIIVNYIIYAGV